LRLKTKSLAEILTCKPYKKGIIFPYLPEKYTDLNEMRDGWVVKVTIECFMVFNNRAISAKT